MRYDFFSTPLGNAFVIYSAKGLHEIFLLEKQWQEWAAQRTHLVRDPVLCRPAVQQLQEYFQGKRDSFQLPIALEGTDFRRRVWESLCRIPYGETRSYGEIACAVQSPKAARAVGQACHANPLPIVIPCHRVIGANGHLVGYAGSHTDMKQYLLQLERENPLFVPHAL